MPDVKISELTELTTPTDDDLVYVVDDPGGSPLSRKVSIGNLGKSMAQYAGVYYPAPGGVTKVLSADTLTKVDIFSADMVENGVDADNTTDTLTVALAGNYLVQYAVSLSGPEDQTYSFIVRIDGTTDVASSKFSVTCHSATGSAHVTSSTLVALTAGQVLTLWVESEDNGSTITFLAAQLSAVRLSI